MAGIGYKKGIYLYGCLKKLISCYYICNKKKWTGLFAVIWKKIEQMKIC